MSEEKAALEIAGYRFKDEQLLATALTHSSYLHEHVGKGVHDFERLEFLGDAVVDLVIGEELYRRFPGRDRGRARRRCARRSCRRRRSRRSVARWVCRSARGSDAAKRRPAVARAWDSRRASTNRSSAPSTTKPVSRARKRSFSRRWATVLDDIEHAPMKSAKQLLQEWAQGEKLPLPAYRMLEVSGPEHHRGFEVEVEAGGNVARGTGASKREAQEAAAAKLLAARDEVSDELKVIDGGQGAPNAVLKTLDDDRLQVVRTQNASRIRAGYHRDHRARTASARRTSRMRSAGRSARTTRASCARSRTKS